MSRIFTSEMIALIPSWVQQGKRAEEIAAMIGCSVATLRVRCSQMKISLRSPNWREKRRQTLARPSFSMPVLAQLTRVSTSLLRQRAFELGMSEGQLAAQLLESIVRDDLYNTVLGKEAA